MEESEPHGCLALILSFVGIRFGKIPRADTTLPYRQCDNFLSPAERSFYGTLILGLDRSTFTVCPKVNLADIIFVSDARNYRSYQNRISRKHLDFLICDSRSMTPVLGIELDDRSHNRRDRQNRDRFVDQAFEAAGLPLLHVRAGAGYNIQQIAELARTAVADRAVFQRMVERQDGIPLCRKCGIQMVIRTAKRGHQTGEEFWGCRNFPRCREIVEI